VCVVAVAYRLISLCTEPTVGGIDPKSFQLDSECSVRPINVQIYARLRIIAYNLSKLTSVVGTSSALFRGSLTTLRAAREQVHGRSCVSPSSDTPRACMNSNSGSVRLRRRRP